MASPEDYNGTGEAERDMAAATLNARDNFGRQTVHVRTDLVDIPGEHDFTPERLRYYKDGTRRFLQYGDDANYTETNTGHLLEPDADQTLLLETAERAAYPPGLDLIPSMARRITQEPQAGDVVGGGYGILDLDNFDPETIEYTGDTADGYLWFHTEDTGLDEVILAEVAGGDVVYQNRYALPKPADILTITEATVNWYAVGPALWDLSYTDIANYPREPQRNDFVGAVANDDGKGPHNGSHRVQMGIRQATGNSGLGIEAGSLGIRASGTPNYQFKSKGHSMDLNNTSTTLGEYQVCGALRIDPDRPEVKLRLEDLDIISTPGSDINNTRILVIAIDPSETDIAPGDFETPVEHNPKNSVLEEATDNTATGPFLDGSEDASGATLSNTGTNPGGYQLGRESVTPEGSGAQTQTTTGEQIGNRNLYDRDWALILADSDTAGTAEIDINTSQNS